MKRLWVTFFSVLVIFFGASVCLHAEEESPVHLSGLIDVRGIYTDKDKPATTAAGALAPPPQVATRYFGTGTDNKLFLDLSHVILNADITLDENIGFHAQLNMDSSVDGMPQSSASSFNVIEAYLLVNNFYKEGTKLRLGGFAPPFSKEHIGPSIQPGFTITPSAINAWIWGFLRVYGAEATFPIKGSKSGVTVSLFNGADESGPAAPVTLGAVKYISSVGFVLTDWETDLQGATANLDKNIGYYLKGFYAADNDKWDVDGAYFDNQADLGAGLGAWTNKFFILGARFNLTSKLTLLSQFMDGESVNSPRTIVDDFTAWYLLGNYQIPHTDYSVALRWDDYEIKNTLTGANKNEGTALTIAASLALENNRSLTLEYLSADDDVRQGWPSDPRDDLFQLSYKLPF